MCGLFGFSKLNEKTRDMARFLAYAMVYRGDDSWGATNGEEVIKKLGPITNSFYIPRDWHEGIFHTRGASIGAVTERNAHPFVVEHEGRRVIGIHNGGVSNYDQLNKQYKRNCQVDSEHIFHHLAERRPLWELQGRGTIVWYDIYQSRQTMHLARWNYGDLAAAELEGDNGVVFCSTRDPIHTAAAMAGLKIHNDYLPLEDGIWHIIEAKKLSKGESLGFQRPYTAPYNILSSSARAAALVAKGGSTASTRFCRRCHQTPSDKILCVNCWKILRGNFETEWLKVEARNKLDGMFAGVKC